MFSPDCRWRGFVEAVTSEGLDAHLSETRRTIYVGFDPTSDSLHIGSLVPVMALAHAQRHGHRPLAMVGGGTGLIGDPSGKSSEEHYSRRKRLKEIPLRFDPS
jgi:tyrosyl-tRNA synthetase